MYSYQFGYELSGNAITEMLMHNRLISELEFKSMCSEAYAQGCRIEIDKWINKGQATSVSHFMTTLESNHEAAVDVMVRDFGFTRLTPMHSFAPNGLISMMRDDYFFPDGENIDIDNIRKAADKYRLNEISVVTHGYEYDEDDVYAIGGD